MRVNNYVNSFLTKKIIQISYTTIGDLMKVKLFDTEDELDLEEDINHFIKTNSIEIIDIKYQVSVGIFSEEQVFCFSAMVIYIER